jgi:hypothetical protein
MALRGQEYVGAPPGVEAADPAVPQTTRARLRSPPSDVSRESRCPQWRLSYWEQAVPRSSPLKDAPDTLRIEAFAARQRGGTAELLKTAREDPSVLVADPAKEIKSFTVTYIGKMGAARLAGRSGFIDSVMDAILESYDVVGQRLKDWSAAPPRLRKPEEVVVDEKAPTDIPSAALSSQDDEVPGSSPTGSA